MERYLFKHRDNFTFTFNIILKSRDKSVGITLGYGLGDRDSRVRFPAEAGNFSLQPSRPGYQGLFPLG
jgi:hypothetical protein